MLPVLAGTIARRVLLNFRADAQLVQLLLPKPVIPEIHKGHAIVGICLIRLEHLCPRGLPAKMGFSSENMAHRVAVRYPAGKEMKSGVFIWRRETDQKLVQMLGGRLFPGVHHGASFSVEETADGISMAVKSADGESDVSFSARWAEWKPSGAFQGFDEVSEFFRQGDCGFSRSLNGEYVEGMQLRTLKWPLNPLAVELKTADFYLASSRFPVGSIEFDCGLIMRDVPHEWHEIREVPELEILSQVPAMTD